MDATHDATRPVGTEEGRHRFLRALAHELRSPLGVIRTATFLLRDRDTRDPEVASLGQMIERQAARMAELVDRMLDVARAEQDGLVLHWERLDLGAVLAGCLETWRPVIEVNEQHLVLELPGRPMPVDGDPARLGQLLDVLLDNACRFTPPGGTLRVEARPGPPLCLQVRDSGAGMTPETLAGIFTLFHGTASAPARGRRGLGVGLALARRFAELHGGGLAAASGGPGLGSTFTLSLPVPEPVAPVPGLPPGGASSGASPGAAPDPGLRVLVIDDDPCDRLICGSHLEYLGHRVTLAPDGASGVVQALGERPDLVLVDFEMPGMDGPEVARRIRAALGPGVALVAHTGHSHETALATAKAAGFDAFLVKSADPEGLARTLRELRRPSPGGR
jgi:CheY-like chemotaxis protein